MKVVMLCGGISRRMAPLTTDKPLLPFCGRPLIVHQVETARQAGLNEFKLIVSRDNAAAIEAALAGRDAGIELVRQPRPAGMADAVQRAARELGDEPFILASSNDIFESSVYTTLLAQHRADGAASYLTCYQVSGYFPGGYVDVDSEGGVRRIVEKPPQGKEPSDLINIVAHLHASPRTLIKYLAEAGGSEDDAYERALSRLIAAGQKVKAVVYRGRWQAIKYPWHVLDAMDYFLEKLTPQVAATARISDKAVIDGPVLIEDNVRVLEGAIVRGPSYIGPGAVIGNGALVRNSHLGRGCIVGYGSEVKHSYIGDDCTFHSNYIGDSVIEAECTFGAGAVTANFRLDHAAIKTKSARDPQDTGRDKLGALIGRGSRVGINASLMPGIRIGTQSVVGPGVCLTHDLESGRMAVAAGGYRVESNKITPANSAQGAGKKQVN